MSNKQYDFLNKLQRWLPSLGVFYLTLCEIWDLPFGDQINKTIVAIATLLAVTLEVATSIYRKEKIKSFENEKED